MTTALQGSAGRLPDFEHTSVLSATLILTFILGEFIRLPERDIDIQVQGILVSFALNARVLTAVLTAGLTVSGTAWLLHAHPARPERGTAQHWVLPGLTAWVLSVTLSAIPGGTLWYIVLFAGTAFLALVWIAEYVSVDPQDPNFRPAANGLTILAYALYLVLAVNLRATGTRLVFLLPALAVPVVLISGRYLLLKLESQDLADPQNRTLSLLTAGTLAIVAGQLATAFHYFPVSPMSFGLLLLGPIYAANAYFGNLVDGRTPVRTTLEPVVILLGLWTAAVFS